jgi:hypothetical protein
MDPDPDPEGPKHVDPMDPDPDSEPDPQHRSQDKASITYLPGMHRLDAVNNLGPLNDHH